MADKHLDEQRRSARARTARPTRRAEVAPAFSARRADVEARLHARRRPPRTHTARRPAARRIRAPSAERVRASREAVVGDALDARRCRARGIAARRTTSSHCQRWSASEHINAVSVQHRARCTRTPALCALRPRTRRARLHFCESARHLGDRHVPPRLVAGDARLAIDRDDDDRRCVVGSAAASASARARRSVLGAPRRARRATRRWRRGRPAARSPSSSPVAGVAVPVARAESAAADRLRQAADAREAVIVEQDDRRA